MKINKIGIIGIRGLPARYGAFDTFVNQLIYSQFAIDKKFHFFVSCEPKFKNIIFNENNVTRLFIFRGSGLLILINYLFSILSMYLKGVRKFIFFGYGAAIFYPILNFLNCKVICNPDGIEWRRPESNLKKIFFKFCEVIVSKLNIIRIYDSHVIRRYYKQNHQTDGYVAYYPSVFEKNEIATETTKPKKRIFERFYMIGRLLPENNTEMIVKAFSKMKSDQKLFIIGNSNEYFKREILPIINKSKNIIFLGPIYDKDKLFKICNLCDYYVHGHSVGGTNPTLIEAVSLKKKIICFKTFFNKEILANKAAYFKNLSDLEEILISRKYLNIGVPGYLKEYTADYINQFYLGFFTK